MNSMTVFRGLTLAVIGRDQDVQFSTLKSWPALSSCRIPYPLDFPETPLLSLTKENAAL